MNSLRLKLLLAKIFVLASLVFTATVHATDITFGIISSESTKNLKTDWQPILDDFQKQTGFNVRPFFAPDYAGVIQAIALNKVQVAWMGNKAAIEAVDTGKAEVFAQKVNADGSQGYNSLLIVNKESPINNLDDLFKSASTLIFSNGDPNSTSGFLVPAFYVFNKNNIDPKTAFKEVRTANHEKNAFAVADKLVDVATNNSDDLLKFKAKDPEKISAIKVIWTSPLIPLDPLIMRTDLPASVKKKVADFFLNYGKANEQEKKNLMALDKIGGYKVSNNDQLIPIRQIDLFTKRNKLLSDTTLTEDQKKAALAELDKKLAALGN
jgi:phosphonate transport system substrate-binding protein